MPCTSYPLASRNSARYEPSCPVIPVMSARGILSRLTSGNPRCGSLALRSKSLASGVACQELRSKCIRRNWCSSSAGTDGSGRCGSRMEGAGIASAWTQRGGRSRSLTVDEPPIPSELRPLKQAEQAKTGCLGRISAIAGRRSFPSPPSAGSSARCPRGSSSPPRPALPPPDRAVALPGEQRQDAARSVFAAQAQRHHAPFVNLPLAEQSRSAPVGKSRPLPICCSTPL